MTRKEIIQTIITGAFALVLMGLGALPTLQHKAVSEGEAAACDHHRASQRPGSAAATPSNSGNPAGQPNEYEKQTLDLAIKSLAETCRSNSIALQGQEDSRFSILLAGLVGGLAVLGLVIAAIAADRDADKHGGKGHGSAMTIDVRYRRKGAPSWQVRNDGSGAAKVVAFQSQAWTPGTDVRAFLRAMPSHGPTHVSVRGAFEPVRNPALSGGPVLAGIRFVDDRGAQKAAWAIFGLSGGPARHVKQQGGQFEVF